MLKNQVGRTRLARRLVAVLVVLVFALGACPLAFAADHDLKASSPSASDSRVPFSRCTVDSVKRIKAGSKNLNPIKSVKSSEGKVLKEDVDYRIEYFSSDDYHDQTNKVKGTPTEPGRYLAMLYPIDTAKYSGLYGVYYQVIGPDFVERVVDDSQKADVTGGIYDGTATYYVMFDPQIRWTHYTKDEGQRNAWADAGYTTYRNFFSDDSVLYFLQDPNSGQYIVSTSDYSYQNNGYTEKGLTYNMALCVAVAEASYVLNTGADVVSDDEGYDVSAKQKWVSVEANDALKAASAKAEEVGTTKGASKAEVSAAQSELDTALKGFKPAAGKKGQKRDISKAKVTGVSTKVFTGKTIVQTPVVTLNGKTLVAGEHYTVTYKNAKNKTIKAANVKAAGSYKVVIKGKGTSKGTVSKAFKVKAVSMKSKYVKVGKIKAQKLRKIGKAVKPKVTVKYNGTKLKAGRDYKVTYKNNAKKGKAKAIITGKGNFTGARTVLFLIK